MQHYLSDSEERTRTVFEEEINFLKNRFSSVLCQHIEKQKHSPLLKNRRKTEKTNSANGPAHVHPEIHQSNSPSSSSNLPACCMSSTIYPDAQTRSQVSFWTLPLSQIPTINTCEVPLIPTISQIHHFALCPSLGSEPSSPHRMPATCHPPFLQPPSHTTAQGVLPLSLCTLSSFILKSLTVGWGRILIVDIHFYGWHVL